MTLATGIAVGTTLVVLAVVVFVVISVVAISKAVEDDNF